MTSLSSIIITTAVIGITAPHALYLLQYPVKAAAVTVQGAVRLACWPVRLVVCLCRDVVGLPFLLLSALVRTARKSVSCTVWLVCHLPRILSTAWDACRIGAALALVYVGFQVAPQTVVGLFSLLVVLRRRRRRSVSASTTTVAPVVDVVPSIVEEGEASVVVVVEEDEAPVEDEEMPSIMIRSHKLPLPTILEDDHVFPVHPHTLAKSINSTLYGKMDAAEAQSLWRVQLYEEESTEPHKQRRVTFDATAAKPGTNVTWIHYTREERDPIRAFCDHQYANVDESTERYWKDVGPGDEMLFACASRADLRDNAREVADYLEDFYQQQAAAAAAAFQASYHTYGVTGDFEVEDTDMGDDSAEEEEEEENLAELDVMERGPQECQIAAHDAIVVYVPHLVQHWTEHVRQYQRRRQIQTAIVVYVPHLVQHWTEHVRQYQRRRQSQTTIMERAALRHGAAHDEDFGDDKPKKILYTLPCQRRVAVPYGYLCRAIVPYTTTTIPLDSNDDTVIIRDEAGGARLKQHQIIIPLVDDDTVTRDEVGGAHLEKHPIIPLGDDDTVLQEQVTGKKHTKRRGNRCDLPTRRSARIAAALKTKSANTSSNSRKKKKKKEIHKGGRSSPPRRAVAVKPPGFKYQK